MTRPPRPAARLHAAALLGAIALAAAPPAFAARPMIVDDARKVERGACQVESWIRFNRDRSEEYWALPACNPTGHAELTLGGARTNDPLTGSRTSDVLAQAKALWRELPDEGIGLGMVVGNLQRPAAVDSLGGPYAYGLFSTSSFGGRVVTHTNLGAAYDRFESRVRPTWGLGTEIGVIGTRLQALAEVYGVGSDRPFVQLGVRWWVVRDRVQLDATVADVTLRTTGTEDRFYTLGLRIITPPFMR